MSGAGAGRGVPDAGAAPVCEPRPDGSCSICGDEGLVGEVLEVPAASGGRAARVRLADGGEREVATDLLEGVRAGDRLVIHLGFAIARVREGARELR